MRRHHDIDLATLVCRSSLEPEDAAFYAAAILVAQCEFGRRATTGAVERILQLGDRLPKGHGPSSGIYQAAGKIQAAMLDLDQMELLQAFQIALASKVDTGHRATVLKTSLEILDELFTSRGAWSAVPFCRGLSTFSAWADESSIALAYPASGPLALLLSRTHEVSFFAGDPNIGMVVALLGRAIGGNLRVDCRDPIVGLAFPEQCEAQRAEGPYDAFVSLPAPGMSYDSGGPAQSVFSGTIERGQFQIFAPWASTFIAVVPDYLLSRRSKPADAFRSDLIAQGLGAVISLPKGSALWPSAVPSSLVELTTKNTSHVSFMDARTPDVRSQTRLTRAQVRGRLDKMYSLVRESGRSAQILKSSIIESGSPLSVERYAGQGPSSTCDAQSGGRAVVSLSDVAEVIRPQAAKAMPAGGDSDQFEVLEIATSDIEFGSVSPPKRRLRYAAQDREQVSKACVKPGDILITVKGKVGLVGIVPITAPAGQTRWVVSQSFAILRLKENAPVMDPRLLALMLNVPDIRVRLASLATGSSVSILSIRDLRDLKIRLPKSEASDEALRLYENLELHHTAIKRLRRHLDLEQEKLVRLLR